MGSRPKLTRQRRQQILDAAVEVISERGLCDTRIADVATRAGASAGLVLYYFSSKDRLLTEALAHAEDRFYLHAFNELTRFERARDRLIRLIDLSFPPASGEVDRDWTLWLDLWTRAARDPEVAKRREALDRRWRTTIAEIVREGQRAGEFDEGDVDEFVLRMASLMDGLAIQVVLHDPAVGPERVRAACLRFAAEELGFDPEPAPAAAERR